VILEPAAGRLRRKPVATLENDSVIEGKRQVEDLEQRRHDDDVGDDERKEAGPDAVFNAGSYR
jgi:hypothetical protein